MKFVGPKNQMTQKICFAFFFGFIWQQGITAIPHYYCTPADDAHFPQLKNLIGSIHRFDFEETCDIAVFNLGFTQAQIDELRSMDKVSVHDVEITHPDLLKPLKTSAGGRIVRGFFAWKPVVIKQALELFPYVLYLDAGSTVLRPLDDLFKHIKEHGYFILSCTANKNCCMANRVTKNVIDRFISKLPAKDQKMAVAETTIMIDAGLQGLSRKMWSNYVYPMHMLSYDLSLFEDDGTAKYGYGAGRHDQTLFTIYAHRLGLNINQEGWSELSVEGAKKTIHTHWDPAEVNNQTIIYRSRTDTQFKGGQTQFIRRRK